MVKVPDRMQRRCLDFAAETSYDNQQSAGKRERNVGYDGLNGSKTYLKFENILNLVELLLVSISCPGTLEIDVFLLACSGCARTCSNASSMQPQWRSNVPGSELFKALFVMSSFLPILIDSLSRLGAASGAEVAGRSGGSNHCWNSAECGRRSARGKTAQAIGSEKGR
jgi:hypothetical protein